MAERRSETARYLHQMPGKHSYLVYVSIMNDAHDKLRRHGVRGDRFPINAVGYANGSDACESCSGILSEWLQVELGQSGDKAIPAASVALPRVLEALACEQRERFSQRIDARYRRRVVVPERTRHSLARV